jgi:hypothetical protein
MSNKAKPLSSSRLIWLIALPICLGCQTKVVMVPHGDPVLIAKPVKASVYAFDREGKLSGPARVEIPAGWYALPKAK